jgi:hypothetical protein
MILLFSVASDDLLRRLHQSQANNESLSAFDEAAAVEDAKIRKLRLQVRLSDRIETWWPIIQNSNCFMAVTEQRREVATGEREAEWIKENSETYQLDSSAIV